MNLFFLKKLGKSDLSQFSGRPQGPWLSLYPLYGKKGFYCFPMGKNILFLVIRIIKKTNLIDLSELRWLVTRLLINWYFIVN